MDIREPVNDLEEAIRSAVQAVKNDVWTTAPGIVTKKSKDGQVVQEIQLAIQGQNWGPDGTITKVKYPVLKSAPIHFRGGGGDTKNVVLHTHPVKEGDEVRVDFHKHGFDSWKKEGGVDNDAPDNRAHHLSDATVSVGLWSDKRKAQYHNQ